jgi:hypothetical protein
MLSPTCRWKRDVPAVVARRLDVVGHRDEERVQGRVVRVVSHPALNWIRVGPADRTPRIVEQRVGETLFQPNGGAERESKKNWPVTKSPVKPYPARSDVGRRLSDPTTAHAGRDVRPHGLHAGIARESRVAG